ncbi:hypothetical protein CICLE_v10023201mg [Citrus x clementina]|uniref:Uncharacterized protein n=1 Tax=Citrus clementina TaxID=85681 RepID=V4VKX0_CITCL|nr:hypothetical protein CICLE_v10023201mg [Citrus x clementina]
MQKTTFYSLWQLPFLRINHTNIDTSFGILHLHNKKCKITKKKSYKKGFFFPFTYQTNKQTNRKNSQFNKK